MKTKEQIETRIESLLKYADQERDSNKSNKAIHKVSTLLWVLEEDYDEN